MIRLHRPLFLALAILLFPLRTFAQGDLSALEEQAIKAAAAKVEPSVVRIESIGVVGQAGDLQTGTGPTTGLIVSEDGYIVAGEFNFAETPESILVTIPGKGRLGAKLVSTDVSRKLVLLKVEVTEPLPVPTAVPQSEIRVGQWAIAVGRAYEDERANVSIGVISAVDRIWSKAIQTDAKVSPNNYGGPLVDISGRVFGVLTSLGPDMMQGGGSELYDSGIGFAVSLDQILNVLPRWQKGDLKPGVLGVNLKGSDQFSKPVELAASRVGTPAHKAGLRAGDIIVEANGKPVTRQAELKHQMGPAYAGDTVRLVALRGEKKERIEAEVLLVEKVPPYEFPLLGILPLRPVAGKPEGLFVRYVDPIGPAAAAGIQAGDEIISFAGTKVNSRAALAEQLASFIPEDKAALEIRRGTETLKLNVVLGRLPEETPAKLPLAYSGERPAASDEPKRGVVPIKIAEFPNEAFAFVPDSYRTAIPHGVVVVFPSPADWKQDDLIARWKPICEQYDLILLSPKPAEKAAWAPAEVRFARRALDELMKSYEIDPARVLVHGYEGGGAMAYLLALTNADLFRGVAVVDSALPTGLKLPETNPAARLQVWSAQSQKSPNARQIADSLKTLGELKYPVDAISTGDAPRYLTADEIHQLARWIDSLDRL